MTTVVTIRPQAISSDNGASWYRCEVLNGGYDDLSQGAFNAALAEIGEGVVTSRVTLLVGPASLNAAMALKFDGSEGWDIVLLSPRMLASPGAWAVAVGEFGRTVWSRGV